ncbi:MAG: endoribonuclease [Bacteroidetes bacterium]|jgi:hypothetical protein|nr:endoribonuclease [Bacteroidota bacterium]
MNLEEKLKSLNFELPETSKPGGSYNSINIRGKIAYVAIQFPIYNGAFLFKGRLGKDLTTEDGYKAMQLSALNVIAQVHEKVGFEKVEGLNHFDAYYQAEPGWDEGPKIVNGASDLFINVLGEKGQHSRSIFGVHVLPRDFSAGLTATFTLY